MPASRIVAESVGAIVTGTLHCLRRHVLAVGVLVAAVGGVPLDAQQSPTGPSDSLMVGLSEAARTAMAAYAAAADSTSRLVQLRRLEADSTAAPVLVALVPREPSASNRREVIGTLNGKSWAFWHRYPPLQAMLEALIVSDPDSTVVREAARQWAIGRGTELRRLVDQRIGAATLNAPGSRVPEWLAVLQERAIALANGWVTPVFLRTPPPVFAAAPRNARIRVLAFGDWGDGGTDQVTTAAAMRRYHARHPFTFGITLGDNFYGAGLSTPSHPRWQTEYEALYAPMGIKLYPSLGNHDVVDGDSPAAEMVRSYLSSTWRLPAAYYTFTAGPAQFFAIDGNDFSVRQLAWLKAALEQSPARWKIVYGHFPLDVASREFGRTSIEEMRKKLLPILKGRADLYVAGHHHSTQHLKPIDGVNLLIAGSGGRAGYASDSTLPNALFARTIPGFTVLEFDRDACTVRFINSADQQMYVTTLRKPGA